MPLRSTGITRLYHYHGYTAFNGPPPDGLFLPCSLAPRIAPGMGLWSGVCPLLSISVRSLEPHKPQVSSFTAPCLSAVPFPNHPMRYPVASAMSLCVRPGAFCRLRLCSAGSPRASGHLGIRTPTGQQFASSCSPPRLAATQLPSASRGHSKTRGRDIHPANLAHSRAH